MNKYTFIIDARIGETVTYEADRVLVGALGATLIVGDETVGHVRRYDAFAKESRTSRAATPGAAAPSSTPNPPPRAPHQVAAAQTGHGALDASERPTPRPKPVSSLARAGDQLPQHAAAPGHWLAGRPGAPSHPKG